MIRRKYFKKLYAIYFAFTLVYGVILTSYFVYQNRDSLHTQQINYHINTSEQVTKNLDQRIWSLGKYADTLYLDDYVAEYLTSEENYFAITKVYNKLNADMAVFTDMGARIAVTKKVDDFVITNQFTRSLNLFYEEMNFDASMAEAVERFYEEGDRKDTLIMHDDAFEQIHIVRKSYYDYSDFFLIIQSIDTSMLQIGMQSSDYEFYFDDRDDDIGMIAKEILGGNMTYTIKEDTIYVLKSSGIYPELYYVLKWDYGLDDDLFREYITAAILFAGLTVLGVFAALVATRKLYQPIGTVIAKFEDEDSEDDTRDEFAFLEKMTMDIMGANDELQSIIDSNQLDLRTKFIRDMLHGLLPDTDSHGALDEYRLNYLDGYCRVIVIQLQEQDVLFTDYSSESRTRFRNNVYTILQKTLTLEGLFYELVELSYSTYGLVVAQWQEDGLRQLLNKLLKVIRIGEEADIVMAIGQEVDNYQSLHQSYSQAMAILDYKQSYDKRAIVTIDDVVDTNIKERFYYPLDVERDLFNATLNGNIEKIGLLFEQMTRINIYERTLSGRERSGLLISLLTTLRRLEQKMPQGMSVKDDEVLRSMDAVTSENFETILTEVQSIYVAYGTMAREKTASKDDEVSELMIQYIEEHYHKDVSLEDAATYLNISAGYFCTIFKKLTGTNFKNYLNQYRVVKAKEILTENPNEKIKELTLRLGYNNVNSFIRMFKKYEGISPGEYAKRQQS